MLTLTFPLLAIPLVLDKIFTLFGILELNNVLSPSKCSIASFRSLFCLQGTPGWVLLWKIDVLVWETWGNTKGWWSWQSAALGHTFFEPHLAPGGDNEFCLLFIVQPTVWRRPQPTKMSCHSNFMTILLYLETVFQSVFEMHIAGKNLVDVYIIWIYKLIPWKVLNSSKFLVLVILSLFFLLSPNILQGVEFVCGALAPMLGTCRRYVIW